MSNVSGVLWQRKENKHGSIYYTTDVRYYLVYNTWYFVIIKFGCLDARLGGRFGLFTFQRSGWDGGSRNKSPTTTTALKS